MIFISTVIATALIKGDLSEIHFQDSQVIRLFEALNKLCFEDDNFAIPGYITLLNRSNFGESEKYKKIIRYINRHEHAVVQLCDLNDQDILIIYEAAKHIEAKCENNSCLIESINRNNQSEATKAKKNISCVVLRALDHVLGSDLFVGNKDAIVKFAMKMFVNNNALSSSVIYLLDDELIDEDCRVEMLAVYL